MDGWLGVVIMIGLGLGFAGTMIGLSALLGLTAPGGSQGRVLAEALK